MARYVLSNLAELDLESIAYYTTLNFGEEQAKAYLSSIEQTINLITQFPSMGSTYITKSGNQFQKFNVGQHTIFYQIEDKKLFVVRVIHLKTDFDRHL